ncbi:MAG: TetR/AcrR family transcriptional regulator [Solirubrobacteraceae bacterium]
MPRPARQPVAARGQRAAKHSGEGAPAQAPKPTQRERLLEAMVELSASAGYQAASIAQLSSRAGVSSATFYEQFEGKEDCFVTAYRTVTERVLEQLDPVATDTVMSDEEWSQEARAALGRLLSAIQRDPDGGRVLYIESMAGGPRMLEERRRVLEEFEQRAQNLLDSTPPGGSTLDLPATALVGATRAIVTRHLRTDAQDELPALADDLVAWLEAYAVPAGRERWSTGRRALLSAQRARRTSAHATHANAHAPQRLPRGRHGLPAGVVARSQRTRIIYGTAEVVMAKGYANATVADIVAAAGVARDVFYEHFTDKHHAFLEAQQHPTQHILDTCAAAYFAAGDWPERVWQGLGTLIELIVENPAISHLRLVACYAAGPEAIRRAEEITRSFTIFLEEGYNHRPQAQELPRLSSQAIAGAVFEVVRRHIARGDYAGLRRRLPQLTYVAIAPFTGPQEAAVLLEELSARRRV